MLQFLIILALSIAFIAVLLGWRRDRRLLFKSRGGWPGQDAERTTVLEKANEDLKAFRADLQRRWLNQTSLWIVDKTETIQKRASRRSLDDVLQADFWPASLVRTVAR
jgi:hypothetical protein